VSLRTEGLDLSLLSMHSRLKEEINKNREEINNQKVLY